MPEIELRHIDHSYTRRVRTLGDVSVAIADRSLAVIMGPSGCGKTTLLRILAGLEQPTAGSVSFDGREVTRMPPEQRDIAFAFQNATLYPHLSIRANLAFVPRIRKQPRQRINQRIEEAAELLGIGTLLDRRPSELSAGERQRASLAKCFVRQPQIMLLDEPLANIDAHLRTRLRHDIRIVHQQLGCTTVCVTHAWAEASALADTLIIMSPGRIEQIASPAEAAAQPTTWRAARVVGDPPMNLLHVDLAATDHASLRALGDVGRIVLAFPPSALTEEPTATDSLPLAGHIAISNSGELVLDTPLGRITATGEVAAKLHQPGAPSTLHLALSDVLIYSDDDQGGLLHAADSAD